MLLSEWRATAPHRESVSQAVMEVLGQVFSSMGVVEDPECWVVWGSDPDLRYSVLAPSPGGLVNVAVQLSPGGVGPRATAALVRWSKLQIGEFSVEAAGGRRLAVAQVEGLQLRGTDDTAAMICDFVLGLLAAADGRPSGAAGPAAASAGSARAGKAAAKPAKAASGVAPAAAPQEAPQGAPEAGQAGKAASGKAAKGAKQEEPWPEPVAPAPQLVAPAPQPVAPAPQPAPVAPAPVPLAPPPGQPFGVPGLPGIPPAPPDLAHPGVREPGSVWEVPPDAASRDKKTRTWRP